MICGLIEFTNAIAGDWGGKPFVDLIKGWNHALKVYPEVRLFHWKPILPSFFDAACYRLILIALLLPVPVGVDMLSSTWMKLLYSEILMDLHLQLDSEQPRVRLQLQG